MKNDTQDFVSESHRANQEYVEYYSTSLLQDYLKAYNTAKTPSEQTAVVTKMMRVREQSKIWINRSCEFVHADFELFSNNVKDEIYSDFREKEYKRLASDFDGGIFLVPYDVDSLDPKTIELAFNKLGIMYSEKLYLGYLLYLDRTISAVLETTLIEILFKISGLAPETNDVEVKIALYENNPIGNTDDWEYVCTTTLDDFHDENSEDLPDDEIQKLSDLKKVGDTIYINGYQTNRVKLVVL
jgi:hypothetical protein